MTLNVTTQCFTTILRAWPTSQKCKYGTGCSKTQLSPSTCFNLIVKLLCPNTNFKTPSLNSVTDLLRVQGWKGSSSYDTNRVVMQIL